MPKEVTKGTGEFGQKIPVEPKPEPIPQPEPEVKTPTLEEQLTQSQAQIDALMKERDEAKRGLSTAHSQLTKKDQEIKRQADLKAEIDELRQLQKMGFELLAEQGKVPDGEIEPEKRQELAKMFDNRASELEQKRQMREAQERMNEIRGRAEAAGLTEDDLEYWDIHDAATNFKFQKAEVLLKKFEKSKQAATPTDTDKETKVESEEEKINKIVEERVRQELEKRGVLGSDAGGPAGVTNEAQIRENFRKNPGDLKARRDYYGLVSKGGR